MPKTSAIQRNEKRKRLTAKHAAARAELKAILKNPATADDAFYAAQKKLQKPSARLHRQVRRVPYPIP